MTEPVKRIVVCGPTRNFIDDVEATCSCGAPVYHRPWNDDGEKVCMSCASTMMAAEGSAAKIVVPERAIEETRLHFAKTKGVH